MTIINSYIALLQLHQFIVDHTVNYYFIQITGSEYQGFQVKFAFQIILFSITLIEINSYGSLCMRITTFLINNTKIFGFF